METVCWREPDPQGNQRAIKPHWLDRVWLPRTKMDLKWVAVIKDGLVAIPGQNY